MGCCDKGKTHRRYPKKRESVWKTELNEALIAASDLETLLAQSITAEEINVLDKLVKAGGCPEGQHKHHPYTFCHPVEQEHVGYTDEVPAGGREAAHAVVDEAIADARGLGAEAVAGKLLAIKRLMDAEPVRMYQQLLAAAEKYKEIAKRFRGSDSLSLRQKAAAVDFIAQKMRQAANKLKGEAGAH